MAKPNTIPQRVHKDYILVYNELKLRCLKENKKPPSQVQFSKMLAEEFKKNGVIAYDKFIKFR